MLVKSGSAHCGESDPFESGGNNTHRRTTRDAAPKCKKPNRDDWAKCKKRKTEFW